jgi:hypothetical protein
MKRVQYKGKSYIVFPSGSVEVYIPMGEPRVMRNPVSGHWRRLKTNSKTSLAVQALAKGK